MSHSLPNLPEISFTDLDPASVESSIITTYEGIAEKTLYDGDPVRLFLEALAYIISLQNAVIDGTGKQNLLAYAIKNHLDHLGSLMDTPRLDEKPAITKERYILADPLAWAVLIPQGSRVTTGSGGLVFATDRTAEIPAGKLHVDIPVTCTVTGIRGNGLVPGQINKMVDVIPYVKSVSNVTTSALGADVEEDEPYRRRIQLAPEKFSVAGSEGAYRYHTLSVHQDIVDCAVWRPRPGWVDVRPILKGGELPGEELLKMVREHLSGKRVRPLTDNLIVAAPELAEYRIEGGWTLRRANAPLAESIQARVTEAVEEYRLWQRSMPGRDINPTRLVSLMESAGAKHVPLVEPEFRKLEDRFIARETSVVMEFLGVEDE
jgi:phage-related baseplate assembly protein